MMNKLIKRLKEILGNRIGCLVITLSLGIQAVSFYCFFFHVNFSLLSLSLFLIVLVLNLELALRVLVSKKVTLERFGAVLDYIYKDKSVEMVPVENSLISTRYFDYSPFYNFAPRPSKDLGLKKNDVNSRGFRSEEKDWDNSGEDNVYLSGDCKFFELHLEDNKGMFSSCLEALLTRQFKRNVNIINAGAPHYTMLHCLNKFIVDINKVKFNKVILSAGINDVLVFVHSKAGKVFPDYRNLYRSFNEDLVKEEFLGSLFVRKSILLQGLKYVKTCKNFTFEQAIETITETYNSPENIDLARKLFTTDYFETYLKAFIGICSSFGFDLMLMTNNYNPADMEGNTRSFVSWGIDQINASMQKIGDESGLPVLDMQKKFKAEPENIYNKWQHTFKGNQLRAELVADFVANNFNVF